MFYVNRSLAQLPPFGFLSRLVRDNVYEFSGRGFLFTSPWVNTQNTQRHSATILLSASGENFDIECDGQRLRTSAVYVPPYLKRSLYALDVGLISANITPNHPEYRMLKILGGNQLVPLELSEFGRLSLQLREAYTGVLTNPGACHLMEQCIQLTIPQLPLAVSSVREPAVDVLGLLRGREEISLAQVADLMHLSYDRACHVVTSSVGLSLKSYYYWRKMATVWSGLIDPRSTLTAAAHLGGFSDSAHLARTWKNKLGISPSYIRNKEIVSIIPA